jgi:hypothetical protein
MFISFNLYNIWEIFEAEFCVFIDFFSHFEASPHLSETFNSYWSLFMLL